MSCGKDASPEFVTRETKKPINRREIVQYAATLQFKESLKTVAERNDAQEILRRICLVSDFVAAEARYHKRCYLNLLRTSSDTSCKKPGRPVDDYVTTAIDYICQKMEENEEDTSVQLT